MHSFPLHHKCKRQQLPVDDTVCRGSQTPLHIKAACLKKQTFSRLVRILLGLMSEK